MMSAQIEFHQKEKKKKRKKEEKVETRERGNFGGAAKCPRTVKSLFSLRNNARRFKKIKVSMQCPDFVVLCLFH